MRSSLRNLLVFAACGMLALPSGWCCIVALSWGKPAAKASCGDCSTGCCPRPAPREKSPKPTRAPVKLCCLDNHFALKKTAEADELSGDAADWPNLTITPTSTKLPAIPETFRIAPPRALNVLLCVWLC